MRVQTTLIRPETESTAEPLPEAEWVCFVACKDTLGTRAHLILGEAHDRGGIFSMMLVKGELVPHPTPSYSCLRGRLPAPTTGKAWFGRCERRQEKEGKQGEERGRRRGQGRR